MGRDYLYCLIYDGQHHYVEAPSFAAAIKVWQHVMPLTDESWTGEEQPESLTLLESDFQVLRRPAEGWADEAEPGKETR